MVELLVSLTIATLLGAVSLAAFGKMRKISQGAVCANSLRQLGVATRLYLDDHRQVFFLYRRDIDEGTLWYFGLEPMSSIGKSEGERTLDMKSGPLAPYIEIAGRIETCPAFSYRDALTKPKFKGASFGYGFNQFLNYTDKEGGVGVNALKGVNALTIENPAKIIVFGDCAQVNRHQPPASLTNPMIEEYYQIDQSQKTIHFRHGARAQFVFLDGHVESMPMWPGTLETALRSANIGRITLQGSREYLQ